MKFMGILLLGSFQWNSFATAENDASSSAGVEVVRVQLAKSPDVSPMRAIYFSLKNLSDKELVLTGVSSPAARHAMIHRSYLVDGVAKMEHIESLTIKAKDTVDFAPGSYHVMLMGVDKEKVKQDFEIGLEFESLPVTRVMVKP
ncbi:copper chaperone PCu(A)C [Aliikangiella sp. G2MR2-5]|uniref:copper chaperone PCu(A)C n=1 Tax=Aliikangiella sp. G2MR2-5 TaxID=2788943 RepID=UPI0018A8E850|nr:copper chaperone PCu(A)C [Aliikangiella sp. G2MR2-5]